jgi:hypothetical protein
VVYAENTEAGGTVLATASAAGGSGGSAGVNGSGGSATAEVTVVADGIELYEEKTATGGGSAYVSLSSMDGMDGADHTLGSMSVGTDSSGTFTHDSNTLTVGTLTIGDYGTYNMSGGTLVSSNTVVTEFGTFHQSGGTASVGNFGGELGAMTIDSGATTTATALSGEMGDFTMNGTLTVSHTTSTRQEPGVAMDLDGIAVGSGGKFDITNHDFVEHPTPYNGGMFLSDIRAALIAGRGTGTWDGSTGITSSDAHADGMDLGYASALELGIAGDGTGSFEGIGVLEDDLDDNSTYDVIVKYTFGGDANLDGKVDSADQAILDGYVGTLSGADWSMGDFNYDGKVDSADQAILTADWLDGTGGIHGVPVPEPATLAVLIGPSLVLFLGRRRKGTRG